VGNGIETPVIVSWRKINSDAPVWYMTIEGSNAEMKINRIDDITRYHRFADQCAKQLNRFFPPVKGDAWAAVLREASSRMTEEQASPDTTRKGRFLELLESFLTNRQAGKDRVDLLRGVPWLDEDKQHHEFQMSRLAKFLEREGMKDTTPHECGEWIRELGGDRVSEKPTTIKGKGVRLWWVPSSAVQGSPELSMPAVPEEKI
jgi:hypothetical protein